MRWSGQTGQQGKSESSGMSYAKDLRERAELYEH